MSATKTSSSLQGLSLHAEYYLHNADLHFQVERTIFRVHSYFFIRESPRFRERMTGVDCAGSGAHDGTTDQKAIPVKNTSVEEFSQFLWVFYDETYMYNASSSVWCTILSLSSPGRWDFPKIHALALHRLNSLSLPLVDRIVLYKSCSVSFEHLLPLYVKLCTREESLTLEESIHLGWGLVVLISHVRERLLKGEGKGEVTDAIHDMDAAVEGVPEKWIQDQIRSMLSTMQHMSSVMDIQAHHCPPHHEVQVQFFDLCSAKAKAAARTKLKGGPRLSDQDSAEAKAGPSKTKTQAIDQAQRLVQKMAKTVGNRKSPPVIDA